MVICRFSGLRGCSPLVRSELASGYLTAPQYLPPGLPPYQLGGLLASSRGFSEDRYGSNRLHCRLRSVGGGRTNSGASCCSDRLHCSAPHDRFPAPVLPTPVIDAGAVIRVILEEHYCGRRRRLGQLVHRLDALLIAFPALGRQLAIPPVGNSSISHPALTRKVRPCHRRARRRRARASAVSERGGKVSKAACRSRSTVRAKVRGPRRLYFCTPGAPRERGPLR